MHTLMITCTLSHTNMTPQSYSQCTHTRTHVHTPHTHTHTHVHTREHTPHIHTHVHTLSGSDLPVCTINVNRLQCCARTYIDDVTERARRLLINGLREEFEDRIEDYERIVQLLMQCE